MWVLPQGNGYNDARPLQKPVMSNPSVPESLPIFPLNSVLFPHGKLALRIFEPRYMDMVAQCMQNSTTFGVCLIAEGKEVGAAAVPHKFGTEAHIVDWDMSQPGVLGLTIQGGRRFRLLDHSIDAQQAISGSIQWVGEPATLVVTPTHKELLPLLQLIIADAGETKVPLPHVLGDSSWVGYRYAELLPIPPLARQRLLELEDAELRLTIIQAYLQEHKVLKTR